MKKYGNYSMIAKKIAGKLPICIGDTFENLLYDENTKDALDAMFLEWPEADKSFRNDLGVLEYGLSDIILMVMMTADKTTDLHEDRVKYRDIRRNRKLYLAKGAAKDYKDTTKGVFNKAWESYLAYGRTIFFAGERVERDKFNADMMETVTKWAEDPATGLTEYPFYRLLSPKKRCQDFLADVSYCTFDELMREYGTEFPLMGEGSGAPVMRTPSFISGKGVFSATATVEDLETEVRHDSVTTYNNHTITTEDGQIIIKTIVDNVSGNFKDADSEEGKNAIIENLSGAGRIKLSNNLLDSVDLEIFTYIFSAFNVEDVTRGRKMFKLRDLVKSLYTEAKDERKVSVIEHLNRLGNYKVEYRASNVSGETVEVGDISFFDLIYHIDANDKGGKEVTYNASLHPADGSHSILDEVMEYKAENITVEIRPSVSIRDAMMSSMNTVIYAEHYKRIPAPKAKNMLMFLQTRRTEIYPETALDISVSYLAQNFRLEKMKRSRQVKYLSEMVDQLKNEGVLVKDYYLTKNQFHFEFLPFTETELEAYHIGSDGASGTVS